MGAFFCLVQPWSPLYSTTPSLALSLVSQGRSWLHQAALQWLRGRVDLSKRLTLEQPSEKGREMLILPWEF